MGLTVSQDQAGHKSNQHALRGSHQWSDSMQAPLIPSKPIDKPEGNDLISLWSEQSNIR